MNKKEEKGIECWKVVRINNKNERRSAGLPAYESDKYSLTYPEDEMVEKIPESLGIFCFETYNQAKKFYNIMAPLSQTEFDIIPVKGYSKNIIPKYIPSISIYNEYFNNDKISSKMELIKFINLDVTNNSWKEKFPEGTVAFDKVLVLE